jgi:hypothetical protein
MQQPAHSESDTETCSDSAASSNAAPAPNAPGLNDGPNHVAEPSEIGLTRNGNVDVIWRGPA